MRRLEIRKLPAFETIKGAGGSIPAIQVGQWPLKEVEWHTSKAFAAGDISGPHDRARPRAKPPFLSSLSRSLPAGHRQAVRWEIPGMVG